MVAIAKSEVRAREKRAEEEEKERIRLEEQARRTEMIETKKAEIMKALESIDEVVKVAETTATKAEATAKPLVTKGRDQLSAERLREIASEAEAAAVPAKEALEPAHARVAEFAASDDLANLAEELAKF